MRCFFSCLLIFSLFDLTSASVVVGEDAIVPETDDENAESEEWGNPFQPVSVSEADNTLVLLLVTNDEPRASGDTENEADDADNKARRDRRGQDTGIGGWCTDVFADAYRDVRRNRPDLKKQIVLQWLPAGLPRELTGGKPDNVPARAMLLVCDGNYRLLSFLVGVPDAADLQALIEDAQEFQLLTGLENESTGSIAIKLAQRSSQRVPRTWRAVLEETVLMMDEELTKDPIDRIRWLGDRFTGFYLADVRLRFGLNDASDKDRLTVLEQHIQTRKPWSETLIPFLAGIDVEKTWPALVESVWGHQPVRADIAVGDLANEIKTNPNDETFV
ncbi:MAG: hypothetical protein WBD31_00005, partial [Rubripirellula sp.]